jgi:hypothetical protein
MRRLLREAGAPLRTVSCDVACGVLPSRATSCATFPLGYLPVGSRTITVTGTEWTPVPSACARIRDAA